LGKMNQPVVQVKVKCSLCYYQVGKEYPRADKGKSSSLQQYEPQTAVNKQLGETRYVIMKLIIIVSVFNIWERFT